jgi:hypothetical protein
MHPRIAPSYRASGRERHDEVDWLVADRSGRVLARNISFAQLRARYEHGLLTPMTLVARSDERLWRPIAHVMDGSGARKIRRAPRRDWYVTKPGGKVIGPVDTKLLSRGIAQGRVPLDSLACEAGATEWEPVDQIALFADAVNEVRFDSEMTSAFVPLRWSFEDEL